MLKLPSYGLIILVHPFVTADVQVLLINWLDASLTNLLIHLLF